MKRCPDCGEDRPVSEFGNNKTSKDGLAGYCRKHHNARGRAHLARCGGARRYHLRRRYGVEPEAVEALIAEQGGVCAICRVNEAKHLDHDHVNGFVRGVLCVPCNNGLGLFRDSAGALRRAAQYLDNAARESALERHAS